MHIELSVAALLALAVYGEFSVQSLFVSHTRMARLEFTCLHNKNAFFTKLAQNVKFRIPTHFLLKQ